MRLRSSALFALLLGTSGCSQPQNLKFLDNLVDAGSLRTDAGVDASVDAGVDGATACSAGKSGCCSDSDCPKLEVCSHAGGDAAVAGSCVAACDPNANGTYQGDTIVCACKPGYDGDGKTCVLNACTPVGNAAVCAAHQTCKSTAPGSKSCPCDDGFADCDGNAANGCEVAITSTDAANCGACGYACSSGLACSKGVCGERVTVIAGGSFVTMALDPVGTVLGWGSISGWGSSPTTDPGGQSLKPVAVPSTPAAKLVSVGDAHACLVRADDTGIRCWGNNTALQLGTATGSPGSPASVNLSVSGVKAISAGYGATCAVIGTPGHVVCWGSVFAGLMGDGVTHTNGNDPNQAFNASTQVAGVANAVDIGAGHGLACALTSGGTVYCWGVSSSGNNWNSYVPEQVVGDSDGSPLADATALSVGGAHACALRKTSQLVCWGSNSVGQLGVSATPSQRNHYEAVSLPSAVQSFAASDNGTCAVVADHSVYCWGSNYQGELGTGSTTPAISSTPLQVPNFGDVAAIYSGSTAYHTCARKRDGSVYCWGDNSNGQLGINQAASTSGYATPQLIDASLWP